MLRFMHRNQSKLAWFALVAGIVLMISGFGLDMFNRPPERFAMTINDEKISFEEVVRARQSIDARYQQMFGKNYGQFAQMLKTNIANQAREQIIDTTLVDQLLTQTNLRTGEQAMSEYLRTGLFGGRYDPEAYENFLRRQGVTAQEFEAKAAQEVRRQDFGEVLSHIMKASNLEIEREADKQLKAVSVITATYDSKELEKSLPAVNEEELKQFFEDRRNDYALPLRARYEYAIADPASFEKSVEVNEEEINFYFSEHQNDFMRPERSKVRAIQLNFPPKAGTEQIKAIKDKSDLVYSKLQGGESIETLALEYSDDVASKTLGGDLGWITRNTALPKEMLDKVFTQKASGLIAPIETANGYYLVKVEEYVAAQPKSISEASPEILAILQKRDAPDLALQAAEKVLNTVLSGKSLTDAITGTPLTRAESAALLDKSQDPKPELEGLTAKVLELADDAKGDIVSINARKIVIVPQERKEPEIPELAVVREKVLVNFNAKRATKQAEENAKSLLEKIKAAPADFEKLATAANAKVEALDEVSTAKASQGVLSKPEVKELVLATKIGNVGKEVQNQGNLFLVYKVISEKKASTEERTKKLEQIKSSQDEKLGQELFKSIVNELHPPRGKIDIDPSVMAS